MATVKNYSLAGVSNNLQFGKAGGKIDFTGGSFSVKDAAGADVALTTATPAAADNTTKVATTAYVQTELSAFNDDRIQDSTGVTSLIASTTSLSATVGSTAQYTLTNGKFDLLSTTLLSAANGTTAAPGIAFDGVVGETAGLSFNPTGSLATGGQTAMSVDALPLETWEVAAASTAPVTLNNIMSDTEAKMTATGTATNIDIRLTPKGTGQVFIGDGGTAAAIGSGDSTTAGINAETMSITGGAAFNDAALASNGGSILLTPGVGNTLAGGGTDGFVNVQDSAGNSVMQFIGVASAVNYFTATNSAIGGSVDIAASGTDTNINISLTPKGTGFIDATTSLISNVVDPIGAQDAATKAYADGLITALDKTRIHDTADTTFVDTDIVAGQVSVTSVNKVVVTSGGDIELAATGVINASTNKITNVVDPTLAQDAATKAYVDSVSGAISSEDLVGATTGEMILNGTSLGVTGVNHLTLTNAATGSGPIIGSEGTDANIDISIAAKGTGTVIISDNASITGTLNMNSQLINNVLDPVSAQDAATKAYVDGVASGLDVKASVKAASTGPLTLLTGFAVGQVIDGYTLLLADRILIKDQATGSENGIYDVTVGAPVRSADADNLPGSEVTTGMFTFVETGTLNGDTGWALTTANPITLNTTALAFSQFSGAGAYTNTGGAGITATQTGTDFAIVANTDGATIRVNGSDNLAVSGGLTDVTNKMLVGAGVSTDAAWSYVGDLRGTTDGSIAVSSTDVTSAVNFLAVTPTITGGNDVTLAASGTDAVISLSLTPKGAGFIDVSNDVAGTSLISNVTDPVGLQDAATRNYVDVSIGAISTTSILNGTSDVTIGTVNGPIVSTVSGTLVSTLNSTDMTISVPVKGIDGTAAAPAYAFATDVTSGMYYNAGATAFSNAGVGTLELGTGVSATITALQTNDNITLVPNGTGFIDASSSLISNVTTPVVGTDAANKAYVDAQLVTAGAGDVRTLKTTFALTAAATLPFSSAIPAGATITRITMKVTTASDTASTVVVGIAGNTGKYMTALENDPAATGLYISEVMELEAGAVTPDVVVATPGTVGSIDVIVEYRAA